MINTEGIDLLKEFEGFRSKAYPDPATGAEPWTIGYGFTRDVNKGDTITRGEADARLTLELAEYEQSVRRACVIQPNENELAAMTVFAWNVGIAGFKKSSVLKAHNRGDKQAAARSFSLWNKAGGKVMAGLTRRRAAEAALYLKPAHNAPPLPMPQQVDAESSLLKSPIAVTSAVTGTAATVGAASQGVRDFKDMTDGLGGALPWVIAVVAVVVAGYLIYQRYKQRRGGFA